jgi:hypothetical protein
VSTEYGGKVALALRAVYQLHSDTSRMLVDLDDKRIGAGWTSVFGNIATSSISTTVRPESGCWMSEGVYRYYVKPPALDLVEGILVPFFHFQQKSKEPLLVAAQIKFQAEVGGSTLSRAARTRSGFGSRWERRVGEFSGASSAKG